MDTHHREDISRTAGVYNSKCNSFELGMGKIFDVCLYCCGFLTFLVDIHLQILIVFFLIYFLLLIKPFHQGHWIPERVPLPVWHFKDQPWGLLQPHDQICSAHCGGKRPGPPAVLLHLTKLRWLRASRHHHHQTRLPCQTAQEAWSCCQR